MSYAHVLIIILYLLQSCLCVWGTGLAGTCNKGGIVVDLTSSGKANLPISPIFKERLNFDPIVRNLYTEECNGYILEEDEAKPPRTKISLAVITVRDGYVLEQFEVENCKPLGTNVVVSKKTSTEFKIIFRDNKDVCHERVYVIEEVRFITNVYPMEPNTVDCSELTALLKEGEEMKKSTITAWSPSIKYFQSKFQGEEGGKTYVVLSPAGKGRKITIARCYTIKNKEETIFFVNIISILNIVIERFETTTCSTTAIEASIKFYQPNSEGNKNMLGLYYMKNDGKCYKRNYEIKFITTTGLQLQQSMVEKLEEEVMENCPLDMERKMSMWWIGNAAKSIIPSLPGKKSSQP